MPSTRPKATDYLDEIDGIAAVLEGMPQGSLQRARQDIKRAVEFIRSEIARKDTSWNELMSERYELLDRYSEEKAREAARIALEHIRTITLADGEYAILELGYVHEGMVDAIRDGVPDDIRGRLLVVDGQVHTLKPDPA